MGHCIVEGDECHYKMLINFQPNWVVLGLRTDIFVLRYYSIRDTVRHVFVKFETLVFTMSMLHTSYRIKVFHKDYY